MKRFILLSASLLFIFSVNSQNKVVFQDAEGTQLADTVEIFYEQGTDHLTFDCFIANTDTENNFKIRLKRVVLQPVEDAKDNLCIGMYCSEFRSTQVEGMTAGGDSIFKNSRINTTQPWDLIWLTPDSTAGMAIYKYFIVSETNQPDAFVDQDSVVVKYDFAAFVSILDNKHLNNALIESYPNPVSDVLKIRYQISTPGKAVLAVYNTLGKRMISIPLDGSNGNQEIQAQNWKSGLYFMAIESQGVNNCIAKSN